MTLTATQEKALLHKHLTGDFPGLKNGAATLKALFAAGLIKEEGWNIRLTDAGIRYCDDNHRRIAL